MIHEIELTPVDGGIASDDDRAVDAELVQLRNDLLIVGRETATISPMLRVRHDWA